jgi:hypothetical protein
MIKEFKYRPPIKYLLIGLSSIASSLIFFAAIGRGEIWFSFVVGFFGLICFAMGATFATIYFNKMKTKTLIVGDGFIEIPGRWKKRRTLKFTDINDIGEIDTYDHVIEISSKSGNYLIERQWMRRKDFYALRDILKENIR